MLKVDCINWHNSPSSGPPINAHLARSHHRRAMYAETSCQDETCTMPATSPESLQDRASVNVLQRNAAT